MGLKHTIKQNSCYFLTLTVVGWIDVFTRQNHRDTIINALRYCIANKGLKVYSYCLMTNHLHMVVSSNEPFELNIVLPIFKTTVSFS
jgi:putative transposase